MQDAKKGIRKRQVPAVTRAVAILRQLAREPEPVGVNPLARSLGLIPSTCLHILRALQDEGLVVFDPEKKLYSIGLGILPLARSALQRNSFTTLVQPHLDQLSEEFGVTGIATQLTDPVHMVVVAMSQSSMPFRLQVDLGSRFPALISATGRCFAAFNRVDDAKLRADFDELSWDHPPAYETWLAEVTSARKNGYAVDSGTYISGVTVVAVPMFDTRGQMFRSLVAIGISERIQATGADRIAEKMLAYRDEISKSQMELGG
ncbi:IclR family transcriptional regulator [Roseibium sp. Sym1]|uniref:IclR family transcriptional regulator n=1 Tax=Roseibium sp. Sym1 TaxID=3016006 RepID=UPI0022B5E158|nr:IclR family transcriptional regulator [Roseibium sp. Sym1]